MICKVEGIDAERANAISRMVNLLRAPGDTINAEYHEEAKALHVEIDGGMSQDKAYQLLLCIGELVENVTISI